MSEHIFLKGGGSNREREGIFLLLEGFIDRSWMYFYLVTTNKYLLQNKETLILILLLTRQIAHHSSGLWMVTEVVNLILNGQIHLSCHSSTQVNPFLF